MRDGRVVQQGAIDEVWRAPADAETALFLGYARVLDGDAAATGARGRRRCRPAYGRRAAPLGAGGRRRPATSGGRRDVGAASRRSSVRLVVDVDGVGEVDAVAPLRQPRRRRATGRAARSTRRRLAVLSIAADG